MDALSGRTKEGHCQAWAAMDGSFKIRANGQSMALPARLTMVLEKRADQSLIMQGHFSFPAAGQEEGESIPA